MYNPININPAYAGSKDAITIFGLYRNQWIGLEGVRVTATLSINSPVGKNVGLDFNFRAVNIFSYISENTKDYGIIQRKKYYRFFSHIPNRLRLFGIFGFNKMERRF